MRDLAYCTSANGVKPRDPEARHGEDRGKCGMIVVVRMPWVGSRLEAIGPAE
jgi:hypothetical protein